MKKGTVVRLKRKLRGKRNHKRTAVNVGFYRDIEGGVILDTPLEGFWSWNVRDLEVAKRPPR